MYQQVKNFNLKNMGTKAGWCLQNVRLAFGITVGKYPSAKADMEAQRKAGTLHPYNTLPNNCAVPVYINTSDPNEHVEVCVNGTAWYSDGRRVSAPKSGTVYGWGETCDGVRVVKQIGSKTNEQVADEVIRGLWGNGQTRINRLKDAGYDPAKIQDIVNKKIQGSYKPSKKTNEAIAREVIAGLWGNGSARKKKLEAAGYDYNTIQNLVNKLLS